MIAHATVKAVVEAGLCHGCGTCAGVCPRQAITISETPGGFLVPRVEEEFCDECGLCVKVCPGSHLEPGLLRDDVDPFHGEILAAFLVQATDPDVLGGAQSGAAVSGLLCHLLDTGQIEAAVVATMPADGSLRPRAVRATSRQMILDARGSLYCPVPLNQNLPPMLARAATAYVGLGCQVHGLRNAMARCPKLITPPAIVVGLICVGYLSFRAIEHLIGTVGLSPKEVNYFRFRSKKWHGWPGDGLARTAQGSDHCVPNQRRLRCKASFEGLRCRLCFDQMNVLSDLAVGDPWGLDDDAAGKSVVLARTERGLAALRSAESAGALALDPVKTEDVLRGQTVDTRQRRDWTALTAAWHSLGGEAVDFGIGPRWQGRLNGLDLRPYRQRLQAAQELEACRTLREVRRLTRRRLRRPSETVLAKSERLLRELMWGLWTLGDRPHATGRPLEVLLVGINLSMNLGGPALLAGTLKSLGRYFTGARFTLLSSAPAGNGIETRLADHYGVRLLVRTRPKWPVWKQLWAAAFRYRLTGRLTGSERQQEVLRSFGRADVIIDMTGIGFADTLGKNTWRSRLREGGFYLIAKLFGKPVINYTAAFGPFEKKWNRRFARLYLNHFCDLVLVRDHISHRMLKRLRIRTPMLVCPDTAFLLDAVESDDSRRLASIRRSQPVVGVSVSYQAYNRAESPEGYVAATAQLIRHAIGSLGAHVVITPNELSGTANDDRAVARKIYARVADLPCEVLTTDNRPAEEVKGAIAQCDAMVAARYHSIVSALGAGVPVLAVAWHHKYAEVLGLFGQAHHLCTAQDANGRELIEKFDRLWENRHVMRAQLLSGLPFVRERVYDGARSTYERLRNLPKLRPLLSAREAVGAGGTAQQPSASKPRRCLQGQSPGDVGEKV